MAHGCSPLFSRLSSCRWVGPEREKRSTLFTRFSATNYRNVPSSYLGKRPCIRFIGNELMGWKVAWSDRMISFYTSVWLFALVWFPLRRKVKPISWWGFILLLLPMALDGGSHAISDLAGIGQGFRDTNQWLAVLTNNAFSASFYAGDALGSFNSIMRLITGLLAGLGIVWLAFPYIFQTQTLNQELDKFNYEKVIEQIKNKNPRSSG